MAKRGSFLAGLAIGAIAAGAAMFASDALMSPGGETASSGEPSARGPGRPGGPGGRPGGFGQVPAVKYARAEPAKVQVSLSSIGVARAARSVDVTSEVTGIVQQVAFSPGEKVESGELLFRLDDREQRIALERARAQYPIALRNAERFSALAKSDAGSALEADNARAEAERLGAELRAAEFEISRRTIRAPFAGVAGLTEIEPGDLVGAGQILVSLDDVGSVLVAFDVPQEAARDVAVGQAAGLIDPRAPGGRIEGAVVAIDSRVDPAARTLAVEARFDNVDGGLWPGATFEISTTSEGVEALRVPGVAVQWDRTGSFVWVVGDKGAASRIAVEIVQREADAALVRGGLKASDIVISDGADRVRPGMNFDASEAVRGGVGVGGVAAGGLD